jgi:hypothetical protein
MLVTESPPGLVPTAQRVFEALDHTGMGSAELMFDPRDGGFKFIDFAPRFWGNVGVAEAAGVDLFGPYRALACGEPIAPDLRFATGVVYRRPSGILRRLLMRPENLGRLPPRHGGSAGALGFRVARPVAPLAAPVVAPSRPPAGRGDVNRTAERLTGPLREGSRGAHGRSTACAAISASAHVGVVLGPGVSGQLVATTTPCRPDPRLGPSNRRPIPRLVSDRLSRLVPFVGERRLCRRRIRVPGRLLGLTPIRGPGLAIGRRVGTRARAVCRRVLRVPPLPVTAANYHRRSRPRDMRCRSDLEP